jgi:hypothetical protein
VNRARDPYVWKACDYRTTLEHYLLADVELSKVDEKRRSIARRDLPVVRRRRWPWSGQ